VLFSSGASWAQAPEPISIVVFGPPSLGAFLPPVIKAQKLDEKNGLAIKFEERTPDAHTAQFNSGEFKLGGSASLLTVGLADTRGVKVTYLFNLFHFWDAVVTSRPDVKTPRDLEGKDLIGPVGESADRVFDIPSIGPASAELQAARVVALSGTKRSLASAACTLDAPAS
jgi:NitT/TauT family transport system substrate-binding protein